MQVTCPICRRLIVLPLDLYPPPCTGIRIGNPLKVLSKLRPRELVALIKSQRKRIQRLVWRLEDASVFTAKFALKAAIKGARPLLVCEY